MTTPNIPLLRKAVEWVEVEAAKPEIDREWDQKVFRVSPADKAFKLLLRARVEDCTQYLDLLAPHCGTAYCVCGYINHLAGRGAMDVEGAAEDLGLTFTQAWQLFEGSNSAARIRELAEEFAGEAL